MATAKMSTWPAAEVVRQFQAAVEIFAAKEDPVAKDFRDRCRAEIIRRMEGVQVIPAPTGKPTVKRNGEWYLKGAAMRGKTIISDAAATAPPIVLSASEDLSRAIPGAKVIDLSAPVGTLDPFAIGALGHGHGWQLKGAAIAAQNPTTRED